MVPSGWDPKEWMRYVTINKFAWLDPTNEILKGPSQGKSAGAFNTLTAQQVQVGDPNAISMYTNLLVDIENTLGKLAGVSGAREGEISNRQAVGNTATEMTQSSNITEKWFAIDANFRKRVLTKFLECCKYAYKLNPRKGQFLLDDMGQQMISKLDEFVSTEYDLHVSNSTNDQQLYQDLRSLSQAAIQNGQATISDLIAISQSESVQDIAKRLQDSAKRIQEENRAMEEKKIAQAQQASQAANEAAQQKLQFEVQKHQDEIAVKREQIQADLEIAQLKEAGNAARHVTGNIESERARIDTDKNGIDDFLDIRRTDVDENYKNNQVRIAEQKLAETERANREKEDIQREALKVKQTKESN